ncbi:MAG: hypothetical protein ABI821_17865 [Pseudomonadota bacterium]
MSRICKPTNRSFEYARLACVVSLLGVTLAGCGGGGSDSADPPSNPVPPPVQPSDPPPTLPPQSATAISLNDNHTVGAAHWGEGDTGDGGQGQPTAGLECAPTMDETYHVHTHVSIFLNGEALAIPGEIGIVETSATAHCFYNIHTHDLSGKIHVEAPAPALFTLGQLFSIWGQPLETTNVGGITGMPIVVYVTDAGVVTKETGDWHNIELKSHREVTIQIGTAITEIPNFTWSAN